MPRPLIVEAKLYRATYDNQWKEDISWGVIEGEVACDTGRDFVWTFDATITIDLWRHLRPYLDWVAPYLKVTYPDGTVRAGQLGLYLVMDSPETHEEISGTVQLDARDPLWLLSVQEFEKKQRVGAKRDRMNFVREILDTAILTETQRRKPLYALPPGPQGGGKEFKRPREWPRETSRLELCNEILKSTGMYPLYTTQTGVVTTRARGVDRLRNRAEVRTFRANVPPGVAKLLDSRARPIGGLLNEVVGTVQTTPRALGLENDFVIVGDDPNPRVEDDDDRDDPNDPGGKKNKRGERNGRRHKKHRVSHPDNQRAKHRDKGRKRTRTRHLAHIDDDATARQVARALADELSTTNNMIRLTVLPDPQPLYVRECIGLAIWNAYNEQIAYGKYAVHGIRFGFTPSDALMQIDCGRVENADDLLGRD